MRLVAACRGLSGGLSSLLTFAQKFLKSYRYSYGDLVPPVVGLLLGDSWFARGKHYLLLLSLVFAAIWWPVGRASRLFLRWSWKLFAYKASDSNGFASATDGA